MGKVPFRLIGEYPMMSGMLCWHTTGKGKSRTRTVVKLREIHPDKNEAAKNIQFVVECPDDRMVEGVPGTEVTPLYLETPSLNEIPAPFRDEVTRRIEGVEFRVGHDVLFPDEEGLRSLTGHSAPASACVGTLAAIGDDDSFYVRFRARLSDDTTESVILAVKAEEIEVVQGRFPIGERITTIGVKGLVHHDIYTRRWLEATKGEQEDQT